MSETRIPVSMERIPGSLLLSSEQQYKIMASCALVDMLILIREPYGDDPKKLTLKGDPKLIVTMGMLAARDPATIEPYLRREHELTKRDVSTAGHGVDKVLLNVSAARTIAESLDIMNEDLQLTSRFMAAVGIRARKTEQSWDDLYEVNRLDRFGSAKSETLKYFKPRITPLTNSGPTLVDGLQQFLHEAEFWIGHYDPHAR